MTWFSESTRTHVHGFNCIHQGLRRWVLLDIKVFCVCDKNLANTTIHRLRILFSPVLKRKRRYKCNVYYSAMAEKNISISKIQMKDLKIQAWGNLLHTWNIGTIFTLIHKFKQLPHNITSAKASFISKIFDKVNGSHVNTQDYYFMSVDLWHTCQVGESQKAIQISDCSAHSLSLHGNIRPQKGKLKF